MAAGGKRAPDRFAATAEYFNRRLEMIEARIVAQGDALLDMATQLEDMAARLERASEALERAADRPRLRAVPRDPDPGAA